MKNYLIIEDNPDWQAKIISDLDGNTEENFHVAESLEKAKGYIQNNSYNAVFADLRLSNEQTPFESLGKLIFLLKKEDKESNETIPIIVITSYPITVSDLIKAINTYQGWIWGWQNKATYDADQLRAYVSSAEKLNRDKDKFSLNKTDISPRDLFFQKSVEQFHELTVEMLKEPQEQQRRWFFVTQIFVGLSLFLILAGAVSALFWDVNVGTLTSITSTITAVISTLVLRQLNRSEKNFDASRNKVLEQYKNALKQLRNNVDNL